MASSAQRCGVIGLGMIGGGVADCLVRKGREVYGYDVRAESIAAIQGLKACATAAELARKVDVVIVSVVSAKQAREVLFGTNGLADGAHAGLVVALMCTIRVSAVRELAAQAQTKGFRVIDVAITTGGAPTASGTAGLMAGGDTETVESVRGVMQDFSSIFAHMGPLGAGMAAKIARNMMQYGAMHAAYEGGKIAEAAGVDVHKLIEVIRTSDPTNIMSTALLKARGTTKPLQGLPEDTMAKFRGWAVQLHKDLDAANELAESNGIDIPAARLNKEYGDEIYGLPPGTTPPEPLDADPNVRGRQMMDAVYGKGQVPLPPPEAELTPYVDTTVRTVFGDLWTRPGLSMRDRRLLIIGATAQLMRPDLVEIQLVGALLNGELTEQQLQEAVLHLAFYVGWPKATSLQQGVNAAIKKVAEKRTQEGNAS